MLSRRDKLNKLLAQHRVNEALAKDARAKLLAANGELTTAEEGQTIVQAVAMAVQQQAHGMISSVVSRCLSAVFADPYEFTIIFSQKRGRTEASLAFKRDGMTLQDPTFEVGGGVVEMAGFALRLACLCFERPQKRKLLVLDEPFAAIRGEENRGRLRGLLESLAEDFGVQFVLNIDVDVYPEFSLGNVIELR